MTKKMSEISSPKHNSQKNIANTGYALFFHISAVICLTVTYAGFGTTLLWIFSFGQIFQLCVTKNIPVSIVPRAKKMVIWLG